jgi:hypothetical protein
MNDSHTTRYSAAMHVALSAAVMKRRGRQQVREA